jgi:NAD dependent epimerase/dehydratase family
VTALILGSTGVVGDALVREAMGDDRIGSLIAVARRPLTHQHPRLAVVLHQDFTDFTALAGRLAATDVVLCALGLSWYQASGEAQYRQITHDYVMACARIASVANPAARFCFVSGQGTSATSSQAWARIKAETEADLEATFGSRLRVFRPGYIAPVDGRGTPYWGDAVMRPLMPFRGVLSRWITDSREVARAMLHTATGGAIPSPAGNRAIIAAAAAYLAGRSALTGN